VKSTNSKHNEYAVRETKTGLFAGLMSLVWGLSLALTVAGLDHAPVPKLFFGICAVLINTSIGLAAITAHIRWLKALDEMLRKIWIESIALTFGVLWIAFGSLIILEAAEINYIGKLEMGLLIMLAALGVAAGSIRLIKNW